jgi:membrane protein
MKKVKGPRRASKPWRPPAAPIAGGAAAAGWLILAGVILAWPREEPLSHRFWRGFGDTMRRLRRQPTLHTGRGGGADSPAEIPLAGWKDIALRTWREFGADRIPAVAAGVAFFALLAVFPALAAFVSLYGLFADVHTAEAQIAGLSGVLPHETIQFATHQMTRFAKRGTGQLTLAFALSVVLSIWSANGAVKALFDGLNVAYEQRETRGFVRLNALTLLFTLGALIFMLAALSAVVATPSILGFFGFRQSLGWLSLVRWPAMMALSVTALSVVYRYGPARHRVRWRWITWGGVAASVLWLVASMLFSWYVGSFGHYDRTYGSLGAVVAFMTWIWISTMIILLGAELNSEMEAQTDGDTSAVGRRRRTPAQITPATP